mgnify:FL=1
MLGTSFYHSHMKNVTVGIGTLFNNIHLRRFDKNDIIIDDIKVPVSYASKQRFLTKLRDQQTASGVQTFIPRIGFTMDGISYDPSRKINSHGRITTGQPFNADTRKHVYNPVPYDLNFSVSIYTKNTEDALQILEQVVPFFTPEFNLTFKELPEIDMIRDIPVILDSVGMDDLWEANFDGGDLRSIVWDLQLTAKAWFYPPVTDKSVIKKAKIQYFVFGEDDPDDTDAWFTSNDVEAKFSGAAAMIAEATVI